MSRARSSGKYRLICGADDDVGAWVSARTGGQWHAGMGRAIGIISGERLVAGVTYFGYNGVNVWTGIASDEPGWFNRSTLYAVFAYPFGQLKVQRLTALVDETNTRSRRFVEHLGFSAEATLEASAPDGGEQILYRMWAKDCRWLHDLRRQYERWQGQAATGS